MDGKLKYGVCDGGPWNAKHLAGHELTYDVPLEKGTNKPRPGMRRGTPGYTFGLYRFDVPAKTWRWEPPNRVDNKTA